MDLISLWTFFPSGRYFRGPFFRIRYFNMMIYSEIMQSDQRKLLNYTCKIKIYSDVNAMTKYRNMIQFVIHDDDLHALKFVRKHCGRF